MLPSVDTSNLKFPRLGKVIVLARAGDHRAHIEALNNSELLEVVVAGRRAAAQKAVAAQKFDLVIVFSRFGRRLPRGVPIIAREPWFASIPILAVGDSWQAGRTNAVGLPVDHYIPDNLPPCKFAQWVIAVWKRTRYLREISPDTQMPGKGWMLEQLHDCIVSNRPFAFLLYDIDRFKSVADVYGWGRAGGFLRALADSLTLAGSQAGAPQPKIAHIGGDDFLVLCEPEQILPFAKRSVTAFEVAADALYDPSDAEQGYISVPDRRGNQNRAALITLSVGAISSGSGNRRLESVGEVIRAVTEMKKVAKSQPGSYIAIDRRVAKDVGSVANNSDNAA